MVATELPPLPLEGWEGTKETLHRYAQIIGKVRLGLAPRRNHWWHVTLHVGPRGVRTGPMPVADRRLVEVELDLVDHALRVTASDGRSLALPLEGQTVARFHDQVLGALAALDVAVTIDPRPFDLGDSPRFPDDTAERPWDRDAVVRWWRILSWVHPVFEEFSGRFVGKTSPVHLFWHSLDLAVTRFSGRRAPDQAGADPVTREAYSHEVVSFGWWAGDPRTREPAFYAYAAPEPAGLTGQPLRPAAASWTPSGTGHLAVLRYDDVRAAADARATLLEFLESAYQAGARTAGWDVEDLAAR